MPETADERLSALLARELAEPVSPGVAALAAEIARRHAPATAAVVFYGSCLRKRTNEGVLDFYVVVDDYRGAHESRAMAAFNAVLPPNVFYREWVHEGETLRTKYNVISTRDLLRGASPRRLDCRIWSRFSQPMALAWVRDERARGDVTAAALDSTLTFVERAWAALPEGDAPSSEALFQAGFAQTYGAELRSERPETIRSLHDAAPERYAAVARDALAILESRGRLHPGARASLRRSWRLRRPLAKLLAIAGLFKTAFTFGDWVPYVLWKIERQTAVRVELTERQRRHPLIFAWPVIFRVLRDGVYR